MTGPGPGSGSGSGPGSLVWRLRVATCCVLLTALSFLQQPGRIVADTKVDLAITPAAWLARTLHAWDPAGNFGQMQNQAYGYLWPMGPFFALGRLLSVPAWAVQRLWWALLLCAAFTGVVLLAGRLGIGTPAARLVGGLAFALSPRILSELGPVSVEAWPSAVAPWVLLPLVGLAHGPQTGRRLRRAVALSALAVATAGGVNATAVLAVLPLPLLWLLTLRPLRWRMTVTAAWGVAVGCATAWWVVPLLVLGRYSPPFLDYIETAATTTLPTDLVSTVRGASHWLAYLQGTYGPGWPTGWRLAVQVPLVVATMVVAGLGLAGLARRGLPHRRFLIAGVLVGAAIVGLGHLSGMDGAFAEAARAWLDAGGAPLRNLHKFDVLLRLPLALGFIHLLGTVSRAATVTGRRPVQLRLVQVRAAMVGVTAVTALAVVAGPALGGGLPGRGSFLGVPGYWKAATTWIDAHAGNARVLVVPGARFPSYLWGAPGDEMVQPLLRKTGWAVRNSIPLAPPATVRLLDTVESVLTAGEGSPGLADLLARSGVRYLLVRADLDTGRSDSTRQLAVRAALTASPGLRPVVAFGPAVGGQPLGGYVDRGLDISVPALQVFEVQPTAAPVVAYDVADARTVVGGPESLLALGAAGQLSPAPTVLAGDLPADLSTGGTVLTDGLRRREVAFGQARDNASATLTADAPWLLDQPAHDYAPAWADRWQTVARYTGVRSITASNSYAEALPMTGNRPEHQPFAALDGDTGTSWRSAPGTAAVGQWLQVTLDRPRRVRQVQVTFDRRADTIPTRIAVRAGHETYRVAVVGDKVTVPLDGRFAISDVRVTIEAVWSVRLGYGGVGITELTIPGVRAQRTLVLPGPQESAAPGSSRDTTVAAVTEQAAPTVLLSAAPSVPACYFLDNRPYCSGDVARGSEDGTVLDRTIPWPSVTGEYSAQVWARPRAGPKLSTLIDKAIDGPDTPRVTASSVGIAGPATRPGAVVDGDPGTVWQAGDEDRAPWLRLDWSSPKTLTGLRITLTDRVAASHPWSVTVLTDAGARIGTLDGNGVLAFDRPVVTNDLTVLFTGGTTSVSFAPYAGRFEQLPVGVGELSVLPATAQPSGGSTTVVRLPCGSGPTVQVGGRRITTAFTTTVADLVARREVAMRLCTTGTGLRLGASADPVRVVATAGPYAEPTRLALLPASSGAFSSGPAAVPVDSVLSIDKWGPAQRRVSLAYWGNQRILALRENANAGWHARIAGRVLRPIVVDGWQQGWIVPAGLAGPVTIEFAPDRAYRVGLAGGAVLAGVVVLTALPIGWAGAAATVPVGLRRPRRRRAFALVAVGVIALIGSGGYAAVTLAALGLAALLALSLAARGPGGRGLRRAVRRAERWAPVAFFAVACLLSLWSVDPHGAPAPQLAGLAALVALWLGTLPPGRSS